MKLDKIYNEVVKERLKDNGRVFMGYLDEDTIGVTTDGFVMYFIPKKEFLLDVKTLLKNNHTTNLEGFKESKDLKKIFKTNEYRKEKNRQLVKIGNKYFNEKLLKNFEKYATFESTDSPTSPAYIYENDVLVGLVMPVRVKEEENYNEG